MANCSFCDNSILKGTGMMYVKKDGTIFHYCGSKCRKNALGLGREGRRQKWTTAAKKFKAMSLSKKEAEETAKRKVAKKG